MRTLQQLLMTALCLTALACGGGGAGNSGPNPIAPLEITTTSLADAQVGAAYALALTADGGEGDYQWSLSPNSSGVLPATLSLNSQTGIISGMPMDADAGVRSLSIRCQDGTRSETRSLQLTVRPRLAIALASLPDAMEGVAISINLNSSGGSGTAHWRLAPNSPPLPAGLSLNSESGVISGMPMPGAAGDYMVTLVANDGRASDSRVLPLHIYSAGLAISTNELPNVKVGTPYGQVLRSIGMSGVPSWSLAPASPMQLPIGLNLDASTGVLSGVVAAGSEGLYDLRFRVAFGLASAEKDLSLRVGGPSLAITTVALPPAREGADYATHLQASGGLVASKTWSIAPNSALPAGLVLSSTHGVIHGSPSSGTIGTSNVTIRFSSNGESVEKTFDLRVLGSEELDRKTALTHEERLHFLTRTEFGVTPASLARLESIGLSAYVDEMLNLKASVAVESDARAEIDDLNFPNNTQIGRWMLALMMRTNAPFQETMTHFWTDHFAMSVSSFGSQNRYYFYDKHQYLRANFAGNLRQMLIDISVQPAMLLWLDGIQSRKGKINENYAREFWELFTLGVDNGYTQADIEESARVFTGFRQTFNGSRDEIHFDPTRHDSENKQVFGVTITGRSGDGGWREIEDLVDLTLNSKPVAEFMAKKIYEHLVALDPSPEIIAELADILRQSNWELKPMLRRILLSNAMFGAEARAGLVKSPVEYAIGLTRSARLEPTVAWVDSLTREAGQQITSPPDVSGWVSGTRWLSGDALVHRTNLASRLITNRNEQTANNQSIELILPSANQRSAEQVLEHLLKLFNIPASASERASYLEYLNNDSDAEGNLTPKPFDATNSTTLDRKVRGLIYILAQHPSYHLR